MFSDVNFRLSRMEEGKNKHISWTRGKEDQSIVEKNLQHQIYQIEPLIPKTFSFVLSPQPKEKKNIEKQFEHKYVDNRRK